VPTLHKPFDEESLVAALGTVIASLRHVSQ
jgi:hypothetical protein